MSETHAAAMAEPTWQGGGTPLAVGHKKLGMWLFIISDSLTFSALLVAYSYVRAANDWPTPFHFVPSILFSTLMTLVLLSSSLTMVYAVSAAHHEAAGRRSSGSGRLRCSAPHSFYCTRTSGST